MEPNTNQPIGTSPIQQPAAPQPAATPPAAQAPQPSTPVQPFGSELRAAELQAISSPSGDSAPKKGMGKGIILFIILVLLAIGIAVYILFAKNQMNNTQKTTTENSNFVIPTPTAVPTLTPEEDLEVVNPESDLLDLDTDVKGL